MSALSEVPRRRAAQMTHAQRSSSELWPRKFRPKFSKRERSTRRKGKKLLLAPIPSHIHGLQPLRPCCVFEFVFVVASTMAASRVDVKVVLLGSQSVGKTCLVERYLYGKFNLGVTAVCKKIAS